MSVDRGFLGRAPGDRDPGQYRSMDDLAVQKTTGLELVRLLRVKTKLLAILFDKLILFRFIFIFNKL